MAKGKKSIFFCQNCGHEEAKWLGQCPACKEWNTFVEERIDSGITKGTTVAARAVHEAKVVPLTEVTADDDTRSETGIKELDRVLGGGIVPGSLVLVGGDPGIGKSTLLLQVCQRMAQMKKSCIFPERSRRHRLSCVRTGWEILRLVFCCFARQTWGSSAV